MKLIHLITGAITLLIFAYTGNYMMNELALPEMELNAQRMMYRASHMYIFFSGVINLVVGIYYNSFKYRVSLVLQYFSSFLLLTSQPLFIYAFMTEPAVINTDRGVTVIACVMLLAASILALGAKGYDWLLFKRNTIQD